MVRAAPRRFLVSATANSAARAGLLVLCCVAAVLVVRQLAACTARISSLKAAFKSCADTIASQSVLASRASRDKSDNSPPPSPPPGPDPAPYAVTILAQHNDPLRAAQREIQALHKQIARKDELLRVRSAQLVDVYNAAHEREKLWGLAAARAKPGSDAAPPTLLAVLAVYTEYADTWLRDELRAAWYPNGQAAQLESSLAVRVLFVIGGNPMSVSDGTGVTPDSAAVSGEVAANPDILRVPSVHTPGNEGKSQMVHDMWRTLAALHDAHFYVKAQANALPNPQGLVLALRPYLKTASNSSYIGCMKSGPVITDFKSPWFEPAAWKFGGTAGADGSTLRNYMLHATANGYALSRSVAVHLAVNADLLAMYNNEDVMVGAWLLGLDVQHAYDTAFCCADVANCGRASHRAGIMIRHQRQRQLQAAPGKSAVFRGWGADFPGRLRGAARGLAQMQETSASGGKVCALYSGGCNGVCGIQQNDGWEPFRKCVAIV